MKCTCIKVIELNELKHINIKIIELNEQKRTYIKLLSSITKNVDTLK